MSKPKTQTDPKTPLRNARREKFAQGLARGLPAAQAYIEAGYRARNHSAEVNASRLWKENDVAARVDEMRRVVVERVVEKTAITMADIVDGLAEIAFAEEITAESENLDIKRKALCDIGKHLGGFVQRKEIGLPGQFDKMDKEQLRAFMVERAKKILGKG